MKTEIISPKELADKINGFYRALQPLPPEIALKIIELYASRLIFPYPAGKEDDIEEVKNCE